MKNKEINLIPNDIRKLMECRNTFGSAKDVAYLGSLNIRGLISYWEQVLAAHLKVSEYSVSELSSLNKRIEGRSESSYFLPIVIDSKEICTKVEKCISQIREIDAFKKQIIKDKIECLKYLLSDAEEKPQLFLLPELFPRRLSVSNVVICYTKGIRDFAGNEKFINLDVEEINHTTRGIHLNYNKAIHQSIRNQGNGFDFEDLSPYVFKPSEIQYFKRNIDYALFWARFGVLKRFKFNAGQFAKDLEKL